MSLPSRRYHISLLFLLCAGVFNVSAFAQWKSIGNISSVEKLRNGAVMRAGSASLMVTAVSPGVIRIRMSPDGQFDPDSSWAVVKPSSADVTFEDSPDVIRMRTSELTVEITRSPCRITFLDRDGNVINADDPGKGMGWEEDEVRVWKTMPPDEQYYGFGEKSGRLNKRGTTLTMWNTDIPAYAADTDPLYQTIPFFYGLRNGKAYGIFFDNTYRSSFDMGKFHPAEYSFGATGGELNYYFMYGPAPEAVLTSFTALTGKPPLPPLWALGYQQCRWSYYPEIRVKQIAANFRSRNIPCDVIYLDIHYMDGYRCFTWDTTRFPAPSSMVQGLLKDGFKTVVIVDPGIKVDEQYAVYQGGVKGDHFVQHADGSDFMGKVWPGMCVFPDYTRAETRRWWGDLHKDLLDAGIRGIWDDMNEPSVFDVPTKTFDESVIHHDGGLMTDHRKNHNVYGMQMARSTYEGMRRLRPDERPFVLTRANYAGGHRYTAAWTGDNVSSWEHLAMSIPMCLNLSISGQSFVGSDIGGFIGTPSGELFARWIQLGVFTPLMRAHSEINSPNKEPWEFGPEIESINRTFINLRYRFLPYIYTQFRVAAETGIPPMRPLAFDYPQDRDASWNDKDFLFGDDLLIAPVTEQGAIKRGVHIPPGVWYDYWKGQKITGPTWVTVDAPLDRLPMFARAGAMIPQQQVVQFTGQSPIDPLTIEVFPSDSSESSYYEDDGISFEYEDGEFMKRTFSQRATNRSSEIVISKSEGSYMPPPRSTIVLMRDVSKPALVTLNGRTVTATSEELTHGWKYEGQNRTLAIRFTDELKEQRIVVSY